MRNLSDDAFMRFCPHRRNCGSSFTEDTIAADAFICDRHTYTVDHVTHHILDNACSLRDAASGPAVCPPHLSLVPVVLWICARRSMVTSDPSAAVAVTERPDQTGTETSGCQRRKDMTGGQRGTDRASRSQKLLRLSPPAELLCKWVYFERRTRPPWRH